MAIMKFISIMMGTLMHTEIDTIMLTSETNSLLDHPWDLHMVNTTAVLLVDIVLDRLPCSSPPPRYLDNQSVRRDTFSKHRMSPMIIFSPSPFEVGLRFVEHSVAVVWARSER